MSSAHSYLKNGFAIRGGKIDPWGTIQILNKGVENFRDDSGIPNSIQEGLVVWSEKLAQYGHGAFRAMVTKKTVKVFGQDQDNVMIEEISHKDFLVVDIYEARVVNDGHLEVFVDSHSVWNKFTEASLSQAATGKKPRFLDNSAFVQVDKKFAGQKVIELFWELRNNPHAAVFTKQGERIPCKVHHPLSYAKWEPENKLAKFSIPDPVVG